MYGSLEDENPFQTVRRLAEYEDYALRLLQDAGVAVPRPYGIVEITPEREYLVVTEFFDGAVEIGGADLDDQLIGQGLRLIRTLWDAGIAHRDIKPGNLMVRAGQLLLIDVAFAQVRPSPWRQAVDLGNMMLVLAVRTDPARVYRQALDYFTEAELAEAFAATRGVASPTQLRAFIKRDPRDLLAEFRTLAPQRRPIVLQRWSPRRVSGAAAMLAVIVAVTYVGYTLFTPVRNLGAQAPECGTGHAMILAAQAVPSAAFLPCIAALPPGWTAPGTDAEIASGQASFWLNSGQAGVQAVTITLTATCDTSGARQIPSDQPGMRRFGRPLSLVPGYSDVRYDVFPGGCVTYQFAPRARRVPGPGHQLSAARWRSCPGRSWPAMSGGPRAWPCAGEVPHARDDPAGHNPAAGGGASWPPPAGRSPDRRSSGGHRRGVRPGRRPRHAGPHPAAGRCVAAADDLRPGARR